MNNRRGFGFTSGLNDDLREKRRKQIQEIIARGNLTVFTADIGDRHIVKKIEQFDPAPDHDDVQACQIEGSFTHWICWSGSLYTVTEEAP